MSSFTGNKFDDRRSTSADAKKAMLAKFQNRPKLDDPDVLKRAADRKAVADARDARQAQRDEERREAEAKIAAEKAEREAAEKAAREAEQAAIEARQAAERDAASVNKAARILAEMTTRKAKRDAKFAGIGLRR